MRSGMDTRKPGIVVKIKKRRENLLTEYITFDIISLNIKVFEVQNKGLEKTDDRKNMWDGVVYPA